MYIEMVSHTFFFKLKIFPFVTNFLGFTFAENLEKRKILP